MTNELWWYVARSCGIVSWVVLTGSVLWGLVLSSKSFRRSLTPAWLLDLHRYLGGLAVIFLALHLFGLAQDRFIHFGITELFVPFASRWRPGAVAWGVAGFYLLLAIEVTSLVRRRLPVRVWRLTHGLALPLFAFATVHLIAAGTDARTDALRWAAVTAVVVVVGATVARVVAHRRVVARRLAAADQLEAAHAIATAEDRFDRERQREREAARRAAIAAARAQLAEARSD